MRATTRRIRDANGRAVVVERGELGKRERATEPASPTPLAHDLPTMIEGLADRVRRLMVYDREPHRFHEEKDGIRADLKRLARELRNQASGRSRQCGTAR